MIRGVEIMRVVVMGGSVAGLSSAKFLSSRNVEVELYERKKEIGKGIVCGGGISSFMLKRLGIDLPDQFVLNTVRKVHFYAPNESVSEIEMNRECGYILDREGWEEWMGQSLIDDGIKVHTNYRSPLEAIRRGDVVVGADGLSGITRTIANRGLPPANDVYIGIQTVARTRKIGDDAISMFFGSRWSTKAYAWAFPIGGSIFRVGTAAPLGDKELTSKLNNLIKFLDATPHSKPKAKMIPLAKPRKSLICGKIAYVGD
ncbi:MAG: NAD(P)/FAD-dependent oxidoreductase, partial [candidate division WOR-3 bacterium]